MSAAALKVTTEARPSSRLAVTVTVPGERCKTVTKTPSPA